MSRQFDYDAIVVGGGPAGSTFAWRAARAGRKIFLTDRAKFPRVKICAGWVTPDIWQLLEIKPADYPSELTLQPFDGGAVVVGEKFGETRFPKTASYGIIRREFDHFLLERARKAGAEVETGNGVADIQVDDNGVQIELKDGRRLSAPVVIGAGGNGCPVLKKLARKQPTEDLVIATETETRLGAETIRELTPYHGGMELYTLDDMNGYAWYVPKGDWLNIGIGRFKSHTENLTPYRDAFMEKLSRLGRLKGIENKLDKWGRHAYKLYDDVPRQLYGDRFLLIGDAGGFATAWAGEGIKPAVQTALLAVETLELARSQGDYSAESLRRYQERVEDVYGPQKKGLAGRVLDGLPRGVKTRLGKSLCRQGWSRKKLIFGGAFGFRTDLT